MRWAASTRSWTRPAFRPERATVTTAEVSGLEGLRPATAVAYRDLRAGVDGIGPLVVAFSGGADSALLAWVARDVLGPDAAWAVTAVSASLGEAEHADCAALASEWGLRWQAVATFSLPALAPMQCVVWVCEPAIVREVTKRTCQLV